MGFRRRPVLGVSEMLGRRMEWSITYGGKCGREEDGCDYCEGEHGCAIPLGLKGDLCCDVGDVLVEAVVLLGCQMMKLSASNICQSRLFSAYERGQTNKIYATGCPIPVCHGPSPIKLAFRLKLQKELVCPQSRAIRDHSRSIYRVGTVKLPELLDLFFQVDQILVNSMPANRERIQASGLLSNAGLVRLLLDADQESVP